MPSKPTRKGLFAVLLVVLFPALAIHVSCVAVLGPGTWGSGMEEKVPELRPAASNPAVEPYAREFRAPEPARDADSASAEPENAPSDREGDTTESQTATPRSQGTPANHENTSESEKSRTDRAFADLESALPGKVFWTDRLESENLTLIATHDGPTWIENQHFYLRQGRGGEQGLEGEQPEAQTGEQAESETRAEAARSPIRELNLGPSMILEEPTLMQRGEKTSIVVARWQPWAVSPLEKLSRYLKSYADPTLRPEVSLYLYPLPDGPLEYWGPGHTLKPSPDRRQAILLRSGALAAGYYSMHLWDFENDRLTTILSLREADPGSGRSFDYAWSADSRAVHITGSTAGFQRRRGQPRSLDLIYLVGDETLYDLTLGQ